MNNREVIEWLRKKAETVPMPGARKMYEAAAKAISCTHENGLISRQAAIDAIDEISREVDDGYGFDYAKWRQYFCELPSALGTNLAEVGTDCISREQAIDT